MIKIDPITEQPIRSKAGLCILADVDEPGEMIGFIDQTHPFVGYTDANSTKKKVQCPSLIYPRMHVLTSLAPDPD